MYGKREAEIVKLHTVSKDEIQDSFSPFAKEAASLKVKMGYAKEDFETKGAVAENVEIIDAAI